MPRNITSENGYYDRMTKLIPGEVVGAYIAVKGILDGQSDVTNTSYYGVIFVMGMVIVPGYLIFTLNVRSRVQILATIATFFIWSISLGGQHVTSIEWYQPYWGSIAIILWTLVIPFLVRAPADPAGNSGGV